MATAAQSTNYPYTRDQDFFAKMAIGIAALIVFGFAQWALRGFVVPSTVPIWVHVHGIAMLSWLGVFITQNMLAGSGNLALHRKLGWTSLALVLFIAGIGMFTAAMAVTLHRVPPFFTNGYFLALSYVGVMAFVGTVGAAIALRRQTQWHRRLMLGATVVLMEPGLGRLLPMPLLGPTGGPLAEAILQLAVIALVARHDRRTIGRTHPATLWCAAIIVGSHLLISVLAAYAPFIALADRLAAG